MSFLEANPQWIVVPAGIFISVAFERLGPYFYKYRIEEGRLTIRCAFFVERIDFFDISDVTVGSIFWRFMPFSSPLFRCGLRPFSPWVLISVRGERNPRFGISPFRPQALANELRRAVEAAVMPPG